MDDKELKELLEKNRKTPKCPTGEWTKILKKIELEKPSKFFCMQKINYGFIGFAVICVVVLSSLNSYKANQKTNQMNEINNFLVSDNYFNEGESEYSWMEEL